jgi:hypothetical protein
MTSPADRDDVRQCVLPALSHRQHVVNFEAVVAGAAVDTTPTVTP